MQDLFIDELKTHNTSQSFVFTGYSTAYTLDCNENENGYSLIHKQKQPPDMFCKKGVLRNFTKFLVNTYEFQ